MMNFKSFFIGLLLIVAISVFAAPTTPPARNKDLIVFFGRIESGKENPAASDSGLEQDVRALIGRIKSHLRGIRKIVPLGATSYNLIFKTEEEASLAESTLARDCSFLLDARLKVTTQRNRADWELVD